MLFALKAPNYGWQMISKLNKEKKRRILFIIVEDRYFISHRLHLAQFAIEKGYEVGLICRISKHKESLSA